MLRSTASAASPGDNDALAPRRTSRSKDAVLVAAAFFLDFRRYLPELPDYLGLLLLAIPVYVTALFLLRRPTGAFVLMWVFAVIAPLIEFSPRFGLLVPLYVGACRWPARTAQVALAACAIPIALGSSFFYFRLNGVLMDGPSGPRAWLSQLLLGDDIVLWIAVTVAAWGWGRLTLLTDLRLRDTQQLHAALAAQEVQAERLRLARELHDNVGHALSAIIMQSAGVRTLVRQEDDQISHSLNMIQDTGVMAMKDLHGVLGLLRSEGSPTLPAEGKAIEDLETLFEVARASGLVVDTIVTGTPVALSGDAELAVYRVVQECIDQCKEACR